jgi:putative redox protein
MVISKSGNTAYLTEIWNGTESISSDVAEEKGGSGKYFRPHDLLEAAYASCLNITTRMVLDSLTLPYEEVTVKVELDRRDDTKTIFTYHIDIVGTVDEETKQKVLKLVMNCPVKKTLLKQVEFRNETRL